ncbi:MAG: hypothetical protein ACHQLQ_01810 [Candidatus Acidiferrales bacterium]
MSDVFGQIHAEMQQRQPPPGGADIFSQIHSENQSNTKTPPRVQDQPLRAYDWTGFGALQRMAGELSDWAKGKADQAQTANLAKVASGQPVNPMESGALSPRAGYDLLSHTAGLVSSFLEPKNVAITAGVIAANAIGPVTGIPVDMALAAHGGYGVAKNAPAALEGDPDAAERALLSASEMVGGAAGTAAQVRAGYSGIANLIKGTPSGAGAPAVEGGAGPEAGPQAPGGPGRIARTLGITDPPPNQLLTKAIKPLASNTGWDNAIAKAAPDMKAVESSLSGPISGIDDALDAASIAKKGLWQQYAAKLEAAKQFAPNAPSIAAIDGNEIGDAMIQSIDKRTQLQNPGLVERITKVADTYRRTMPVEEAEDFLQSANNDLHSYYAKNKVGRRVAQGDPEIGSTVAEADQLRDSLYSKLDELTGPGAADLKARYGALSNVEAELLRRKNVSARQQPETLAETIGMARSFGKIAAATLRGSPGQMLEGVQSLAAAKWLAARGRTDAMITRAFQALGQPPATPAATGPGAGTAGTVGGAANAVEREQ